MKYKAQIMPHVEKLEQAVSTAKEIIDTKRGTPAQASHYLEVALKHLEKINELLEIESD
jgi:hypothetical protein